MCISQGYQIRPCACNIDIPFDIGGFITPTSLHALLTSTQSVIGHILASNRGGVLAQDNIQ